MSLFLHGAIFLGFAVLGIFFLKFWKQSNDRLFLLFACSFFLMSVNRIGFLVTGTESELRTYVYYVRLAAFLLIIWAIVDKNLRSRAKGAKRPGDAAVVINDRRD